MKFINTNRTFVPEMLNKILSISFAVFYLITSVGVQLNVHYCMNEVESIDLFTESKGCCCKAFMPEMADSCCGDETILVQADDDDKWVTNNRFEFQPVLFVAEPIEFSFVTPSVSSQLQHFGFSGVSPPPKRDLWLLNCSLTYYG